MPVRSRNNGDGTGGKGKVVRVASFALGLILLVAGVAHATNKGLDGGPKGMVLSSSDWMFAQS